MTSTETHVPDGLLCSCGRPAVLAHDTEFGLVGDCGVPGRQPLDPCGCGASVGAHDRTWCRQRNTETVPAGAVPIPSEPPASADATSVMNWLRAREEAMVANEPPLTDCPDWCNTTTRHGWEIRIDESPYVYYRTHVRDFGAFHVDSDGYHAADVCQDERREFGATESTYGEIRIWAVETEMPLDKAEQLAADLRRALAAARWIGAR